LSGNHALVGSVVGRTGEVGAEEGMSAYMGGSGGRDYCAMKWVNGGNKGVSESREWDGWWWGTKLAVEIAALGSNTSEHDCR